jgi:tetratricopeptide (TPR) repeat protein
MSFLLSTAKVNKAIFFGLLISPTIHSFGQQVVYKSSSLSVSDNTVKKSYATVNPTPEIKNLNKDLLSAPTEVDSKVVIVAKTAPLGLDINYVPFFGGYTKSETQLIDDEIFLKDCDKSFTSRNEASDFFAKMGWQYLEEGQKDQSIHRFNLSWLLNHHNVDAYWGLGVVEYQSGSPSKAIDILTQGLELGENKNYVMMVDLATIYIQMATNKPNAVLEIANAKKLLETSLELQPGYTTAWMQMTLVEILENNIDKAWETFHKGYDISPSEINLSILGELLSRKEDPKKIFKADR